MQQIFQSLSTGETELVEVPVPQCKIGSLLIDTSMSLISNGTEKMLVDFGKSGLMQKAKSQPEKVRQVLDKVVTDGFLQTLDAVKSKINQPIPLGYCNVGIVKESRVEGFLLGDRVFSNGPHADVVNIKKNLCVKIPDGVDDESAAFTALASIGLQGVRLAKPTLGETFVVIGVGVIGLLCIQILRANGCKVMAIDYDKNKLKLASEFGAKTCNLSIGEDPVSKCMLFSHGKGVDGVLVAASTKSSDPIAQAAQMCRQRGRIILVGVTGLNINRSDFYEKELTFQVSCSYGPGRYDKNYEDHGQDYPFGFVRWTQKRNFEAVLNLIETGDLNIKPLISHKVPFSNAPDAYDLLVNDKSAMGIVLTYGHQLKSRHKQIVTLNKSMPNDTSKATIGFIGAGNYASRVLVPAFKASGATLQSICSVGGANAFLLGRRMKFIEATSNVDTLISDPKIDTVAIVTRHNQHAKLTCEALQAGKNVFVEKPLALTMKELKEVKATYYNNNNHLMVGFNRRFAPQIKRMKTLINSVPEPKCFVMVMNAGMIQENHWTQDPNIGGGRIIGEACHHIDLMRFLAGAPIVSYQAMRMGKTKTGVFTEDKATITLRFEDGSFGTIHYFANGGRAFAKERVEVFTSGRTLQLNNFIKLKGFNWPGFKKYNLWRQDKGHVLCSKAFIDAIKSGGKPPIEAGELFEVAEVTIEISKILSQQN